ncbi:hypothetical protein [Brevundimonas naejangsanensis]|uniref:hypothetical protein n=1 Tax=Brevundimonas naejangsanensis TaxID=588932 RepID=UPI0039F67D47
MTVAVLDRFSLGRQSGRQRAVTIGASVVIHGLLLAPLAFHTVRPAPNLNQTAPAVVYLDIEPRPLLPHERPRLPRVAPAPAPQVRPAGPVSRQPAPALPSAERPAPLAPRLAREAPEGTPAPPAEQAADPWQVTPESQAAATARALRTSPVGCRSPELLTRAERVICDERFNERAAEAAARRPITGSGNPDRDTRFAREGARELQRYEAKRRPLSGGVGVLAPQDCPGSNFGTGCAGAHLDSSMQMDSSRNVQTRRDGAPASGRPMTPGAAGPREPMRPQ